MADFSSQITLSPLSQWRDKDRKTGIQVLLDVGICSEEENMWLVCLPIANHSLVLLHPHTSPLPLPSFVCDPPRTCHQLCYFSKAYCKSQEPSRETWQAIGFLHAQENLPGCHLDSCEVETLSTIFHLHFFPLRITVAMHEFIKPLAIKLILGMTRAVGVNSFNMKIPVKWQP